MTDRTTDEAHLGILYVDDEWPHGLRCGQCRHLFREGERYSTRLLAMQEEVPISMAVCVSCAIASHAASGGGVHD